MSIRKRWLSALSLVVLGGSTVWWAARGSRVAADRATLGEGLPTAKARAASATNLDRTTILTMARSEAGLAEIVARYAEFASNHEMIGARETILDTLFEIDSLPMRLKATLDAVAADATPPEHDPLWSRAVDQMVRTWEKEPSRLSQGQDLMLMESRPRARRFLATAMARLGQTPTANRVSEDQRRALAGDLIDVYFEPGAEAYRGDLRPGIAALGGHDVGLLLSQTTAGVRRADLDVLVARERATREAMKSLASGANVAPAAKK